MAFHHFLKLQDWSESFLYATLQGSGLVYESLLKPYMSKHETDIDRNLQEFRVRAWDLLIYYWQNCTELGQTTFLHMVHYLASQVGKLRQPGLVEPPEVITT